MSERRWTDKDQRKAEERAKELAVNEYVTTAKGHKAHRRNPNNFWATLCGKAIDGLASSRQIEHNPHLICTICMRKAKKGERS